MTQRELPRYKCHKEVQALKLAAVASFPGTGGALLTPEDGRYAPFSVDAAFVAKHDPRPGGYFVVYEDGYRSFSPASAFEGGYRSMPEDPIEQMIQAKGLTAPRVTPADIEANIAGEYWFTAEQAVGGFHRNMVDRFLGWRLPEDFAPDAGIAFIPTNGHGPETPFWPTGTNLLCAEQAKEMLEYVVGSAPVLPSLGLLTFCVIVLKNGFTVTGESACVSPENFDAEVGRQIARKKAVEKIWPLMGFALAERLRNA